MIVTITLWYMEGEQRPNQRIYLHTWHSSGTRGTLPWFFLDKQITYWGSQSHPHTWPLLLILTSDKKKKKEKLRQGNRKKTRKGKKKKNKTDKGAVKTGGGIHSQSWRTITSLSRVLRSGNPSDQLDLLLWEKGRNITNIEGRAKAFNTYFCSIFGKEVSCGGPVITECFPFQQ